MAKSPRPADAVEASPEAKRRRIAHRDDGPPRRSARLASKASKRTSPASTPNLPSPLTSPLSTPLSSPTGVFDTVDETKPTKKHGRDDGETEATSPKRQKIAYEATSLANMANNTMATASQTETNTSFNENILKKMLGALTKSELIAIAQQHDIKLETKKETKGSISHKIIKAGLIVTIGAQNMVRATTTDDASTQTMPATMSHAGTQTDAARSTNTGTQTATILPTDAGTQKMLATAPTTDVGTQAATAAVTPSEADIQIADAPSADTASMPPPPPPPPASQQTAEEQPRKLKRPTKLNPRLIARPPPVRSAPSGSGQAPDSTATKDISYWLSDAGLAEYTSSTPSTTVSPGTVARVNAMLSEQEARDDARRMAAAGFDPYDPRSVRQWEQWRRGEEAARHRPGPQLVTQRGPPFAPSGAPPGQNQPLDEVLRMEQAHTADGISGLVQEPAGKKEEEEEEKEEVERDAPVEMEDVSSSSDEEGEKNFEAEDESKLGWDSMIGE